MSKRLFAMLAVLIVASIMLTACGGPAFECTDAIGCVDIAPDEPVHIAYMLTISGATAFLGEDSQGAIEIAVDDRGGELLGHPISLTGEDTLCSAEGGQTAATKVAADPTVVGVISTNCSSAATAAMPTISNAGLVMLSPSNTAPALTLEGETWQPGYFRICHTDLFQGSVAAEFAYNELGATNNYAQALEDPLIRQRVDRGELFNLGRVYWAGQLQIELHPLVHTYWTAILNLCDSSGILQPELLWDMTTNTQLIFGANLYWGGSDTEYGGFYTTVAGSAVKVVSADQIYLWLTYHF